MSATPPETYSAVCFDLRQDRLRGTPTTSRRRYCRAFDLTAMILRKNGFWCPRNRPSFGGIGNLFANFSNDLWRKIIRLKLLACERLSRPVLPRKPSRVRFSKRTRPPKLRPKRKAPARGRGFQLRDGTQHLHSRYMPSQFKRFPGLSSLPRCRARRGRSAGLDVDCLGGLYSLSGLLDG
jgi:hypothetical protein